MRLFHASYRDRHGKKRKTRTWYIEFRDHLDRVQRLPAFKDKDASRTLAARLEDLLVCKARGQPPDLALIKWLETLRPALRKRLASIGLIDSGSFAATRSLRDHVAEYQRYLLDRGGTEKHADLTANRVNWILDGIGAASWLQIKGAAVMRYLADRRARDNLSAASCNHYLRSLKGFCSWMVDEGRASASPVAGLKGQNVQADRRHERRALTAGEVRRVIEAAADGPGVLGMTGPERAMLYRLAIETGLRAGELRSLTAASFDLDGQRPQLTVEAAHSKHRQKDVVELRPNTARELRAFLARKAPAAAAFALPRSERVVKMLRADLEAAGIPYRDESGRVADFHALRHTAGSLLLDAGVNLKTVQTFMRHASITLTADLYGHTYLEAMTDALQRLPDLSDAMGGRKKDGKAALA